MSRSYKKAILKDRSRNSSRWIKRCANKAVRKSLKGECINFGAFKRYFESWNISDYKIWYYDYQYDLVSFKELFGGRDLCIIDNQLRLRK